MLRNKVICLLLIFGIIASFISCRPKTNAFGWLYPSKGKF